MPQRQITLKEVAQKAGVSIMTASRALRNQASVTETTRQKVEKAAQQLNYRPNPLVSALMSYRRASRVIRDTLTIALITNFPKRDGWRSLRINQDFFDGATQACMRHGYKLEEFWLREADMSARRLSSILYSRNINGLLIAPLPVALGHMRLEWPNFSAVALGYSLAWPRLHRAVNHQFRSISTALRRLRKLGYQKIGLALRSSIDERVEHHYSGGFLVNQQRIVPAHRVPMHVVAERDWTEKNFSKWFLKHRPEVVVSHHEEVLEWLARLKVRVPHDAGFIHLNLPDTSGRLAGIYQNGPDVGAAAADFLVAMLHRNERGIPELPHTILVEGTWIDGKTLLARSNYNGGEYSKRRRDEQLRPLETLHK
jgi:DNA-binding LacI/PurR family transcriptional regulator